MTLRWTHRGDAYYATYAGRDLRLHRLPGGDKWILGERCREGYYLMRGTGDTPGAAEADAMRSADWR